MDGGKAGSVQVRLFLFTLRLLAALILSAVVVIVSGGSAGRRWQRETVCELDVCGVSNNHSSR